MTLLFWRSSFFFSLRSRRAKKAARRRACTGHGKPRCTKLDQHAVPCYLRAPPLAVNELAAGGGAHGTGGTRLKGCTWTPRWWLAFHFTRGVVQHSHKSFRIDESRNVIRDRLFKNNFNIIGMKLYLDVPYHIFYYLIIWPTNGASTFALKA